MFVAWTAVLLVLALLVGGYYLAVAEGRAYQNSLQANQYLLKARTAYRQLINMETSERGYIISADESFSSQYSEAQKQLPVLWTYLTAKAGAVHGRARGKRTRSPLTSAPAPLSSSIARG